jgi:RHS repeat-associated protein
MAYSSITRAAEDRIESAYQYDALGRRIAEQDVGGENMRTLYDGLGFEVIRQGVTFRNGSFTTQSDSGITRQTEPGAETAGGNRYRWIENTDSGDRTRSTESTAVTRTRYTGIGVTLYGNGEAVAVSRSAGSGTRGTSYLGKDLLGSVRSATNDLGNLEDRYEYDAFGKPYKGDLTQGMNLGYTGKPYDSATGMYNYGYRDYKPEMGRCTTPDPMRDGNTWFAYVNNDPVNYIDLWGLSASDPTFWDTTKDIIGKVWAAPWTVFGFVTGALLTGISYITGHGGRIEIRNNAITFTIGFNFRGSITLGNTIIHAGPEGVQGWNADSTVDRYDQAGNVNLGKHEEGHTRQYQKYGIFTPLLIIGSAIKNGGGSSFHDFMGASSFEKEADNYATISGSYISR